MHRDRLHGHSRIDALRAALRSGMAALILLAAGSVHAEDQPAGPALSERAAIKHALARPALRKAEDARLAAAEGAVAQSGTRPNPVVSLEHERAAAPEGSGSETAVMLSQTFDISGRRALRTDAARTRVEAARLDGGAHRLALVQEVRRTFAETLYRQQLRKAHAAWLQRIESALSVVARLAAAGEASGYDRRRLEREVHAAKTRLRTVEAEASRSREMLAGLIAKPVPVQQPLGGDLLPDPPPPLETLLAAAERHPEIASLAAQAVAYEREHEAAGRLGTPDVTVGIGTRHVREPGFSDTGLMLALSVPIPVFDRGQAQAWQARTQAASLQAERTLRLARMQAGLRGLWSEVSQLRQNALSFHEESLTASQELSRIAEASYRGRRQPAGTARCLPRRTRSAHHEPRSGPAGTPVPHRAGRPERSHPS